MDLFQIAYNQMMSSSTCIEVEDINDVVDRSDNILYEVNQVLRRPDNLFNKVKEVVLESIRLNRDEPVKINIQNAIKDCSSVNDQDSEMLKTLNELFKDHLTAYFSVVLNPKEDLFFIGAKGTFKPPKEFQERIDDRELHYSYPTIKVLITKDETIKKQLKQLKDQLNDLKTFYEKKQKAVEFFKENILTFDDFGTISIYPSECTTDDDNIDMPTLNEAIEHECQHLCIFLMSIAKTCIYYGLHFSNSAYRHSLKYELRETEFITLFGSYCNILLRIYKKMDEPKSHVEFIKALVEFSTFGKTSQDERYLEALKSSAQFNRIVEFYRSIYKDSNLSIAKPFNKNEKIFSFKNDKFNKLLKWTLRNFEENLKDEK